jgi:hypothetical protein
VEIQRQSDYYGLDRPEPRQAHLTADQIAALIAGPQITPGLLNTRTAEAKTEDDDAEWGEDGNPQGYVDPFAGMSK